MIITMLITVKPARAGHYLYGAIESTKTEKVSILFILIQNERVNYRKDL